MIISQNLNYLTHKPRIEDYILQGTPSISKVMSYDQFKLIPLLWEEIRKAGFIRYGHWWRKFSTPLEVFTLQKNLSVLMKVLSSLTAGMLWRFFTPLKPLRSGVLKYDPTKKATNTTTYDSQVKKIEPKKCDICRELIRPVDSLRQNMSFYHATLLEKKLILAWSIIQSVSLNSSHFKRVWLRWWWYYALFQASLFSETHQLLIQFSLLNSRKYLQERYSETCQVGHLANLGTFVKWPKSHGPLANLQVFLEMTPDNLGTSLFCILGAS